DLWCRLAHELTQIVGDEIVMHLIADDFLNHAAQRGFCSSRRLVLFLALRDGSFTRLRLGVRQALGRQFFSSLPQSHFGPQTLLVYIKEDPCVLAEEFSFAFREHLLFWRGNACSSPSPQKSPVPPPPPPRPAPRAYRA